MKIGMIGLGRMGGNMAERLRRHGHEVVGFDSHSPNTDVASLAELVAALAVEGSPRVVWVMVPSGEPTESTVMALRDLLSPGDVLVEGGNSNWRDSQRRAGLVAEKGIAFIDAGTSGGIWGLTEGYCLMVGGEKAAVDIAMPIFLALAPDKGFVHAGAVGTGHFTKMIHNGIEYGMMQAYAEGYEILKANDVSIDVEGAFRAWQQGSVVRSWLLDLAVRALDQDPGLASIKGYAQDSGEGRWTVNEAVRLGVPAHVLTASLYTRFESRQDDSPAMKMVAALRGQFGGHAVKKA